MCPAPLLYEPEVVKEILETILNDFTGLGQVSTNVEPAALKTEIVRRVDSHKDFLESPNAVGVLNKERLQFELKLTSSILIHLHGQNF